MSKNDEKGSAEKEWMYQNKYSGSGLDESAVQPADSASSLDRSFCDGFKLLTIISRWKQTEKEMDIFSPKNFY